jgi:hypothetical protein
MQHGKLRDLRRIPRCTGMMRKYPHCLDPIHFGSRPRHRSQRQRGSGGIGPRGLEWQGALVGRATRARLPSSQRYQAHLPPGKKIEVEVRA